MLSEQIIGRKLHLHFNGITTKDQFQTLVLNMWQDLDNGIEMSIVIFREICFELWCCFYSHINISNTKSRNRAEENTRNLLKFTDKDQFEISWKNGIYKTLANLVLDQNRHINLSIDTFDDFENVLHSWQSTGIQINPRKVIDTIASKMKESGSSTDLDTIERCTQIIGPYTSNHKMFGTYYNHSQKFWMNKLSKIEVKKEIIERSNRSRMTINDKFPRDYQLALLFKRYHDAVCVICGNKGSEANIEVSHKIPLNLGSDNFAFDLPINMELLCHSCHKRYEANFDKEYGISEDKNIFVKEMHDSQLRNSPWAEFIDQKAFKSVEKPKIDYSGKVKCIDCRRQYTGVELCKNCGNAVLPVENPFFRRWKK